ncbi:MAG: catalase [Actinomycetota bacterium]|nr:catalase [Actinomycetota bacterium]
MASEGQLDGATAVDVISASFGGRRPRHRALHAKGIWCRGKFRATPEAAALSRAAHLQGVEVPVLARLSNGGGNPSVPDYAPDVRGLAVKFELTGGEATDLVSQSVPHFVSRTPREFLDLVKAQSGRAGEVKLLLHLARTPRAWRSLPENLGALKPIAGFDRCRYYGIHAFGWVSAGGSKTHVRCDWQPVKGERRIGLRQARSRGRDYLFEALPGALPARWTLDVQIAEPGDPVDDPSIRWPGSRRRVNAGTLELTEIIDDPEAGGDIIVFDAVRVTDGVELTGDPVLNFRPKAYSESAARRAAEY